jgi:IclR family KDG regulon transcriptional repressor
MRVITSLVKGLQILEYLAEKGNCRISEVSKYLDVPTSNMTLFLNSLVQSGYIFKNSVDGKYYLTDKLSVLAELPVSRLYHYICEAARKEMDRLFDLYQENVLLAVLTGYKSHYISEIQSSQNIQIVNRQDKNYPPHVTANGKVILAFQGQEYIDDYLKRLKPEKYTERSITDKDEIRKELEEIKERGYSLNKGEYEENIMAVAAPVRNGEKVVASLVIQLPTFRHREEDLENYALEVVRAAQNISLDLQFLQREKE